MTVERAIPGEPGWAELAAPHLARYYFAADYVAGRRVLDAGTGSGYGAALLRAAGASAVVGVDVDPAAIALAASRFGGEGLEFIVDDAQRLERVAGPLDVICCFEMIEHLAQPERFLEAAGRLLAPDGLLLVSTPDRAATPPFVDGRPQNPFHVHEWYRDEFLQLLSARFSAVDLRVQVCTAALQSRIDAVAALRQGLMWSNPLLVFLWRKLAIRRKHRRPWKQLDGLAAPTVADYPIVAPALAPILGTSCFHVALCRRPRLD
jgi:SAM-dependent methyltransferase